MGKFESDDIALN